MEPAALEPSSAELAVLELSRAGPAARGGDNADNDGYDDDVNAGDEDDVGLLIVLLVRCYSGTMIYCVEQV